MDFFPGFPVKVVAKNDQVKQAAQVNPSINFRAIPATEFFEPRPVASGGELG